MQHNYLEEKRTTSIYTRPSSYIQLPENEDTIFDYALLPEEYNIFSFKNDITCTSDQKILLDHLLKSFERALKTIYYHYGVLKVLPKLSISKDSDDAVIVNWAYSLYRIYFDIEKSIEDSFYGLTIKESDSSFQSKTEPFSKQNCNEIVNNIVQYIFNHL